jgi:hypothetical protein
MRRGRALGPRTRTAVALIALLAVLGAACSDSSDASSTASTTSTTAGRPQPTPSPLPDGFPTTVVLALGDTYKGEQRLVAVDVASGAQTVLAEQTTLAAAYTGDYPKNASIRTVGLLPAGDVVFSFGYSTWQLYEVPIDGSSPARTTLDLGDGWAYGPSPDGRWLPVDSEQLHLVAIDGSTSRKPSGVTLPYGPNSAVWSPDGTFLAAVPHFERSAPPPPVGYTVDPGTGVLREAPEDPVAVGGPGGLRSGTPWYDAGGQLHVMTDQSSLDGVGSVVLTSLGADTTHRWVVGVAAEYAMPATNGHPVEGDSRAWLVWWDASKATPVPHLLDLGISLPDPALSSTALLVAF